MLKSNNQSNKQAGGIVQSKHTLQDVKLHDDSLPKISKQIRYRQKNIAQGKCPHCGKPCSPFYECEDRRNIKKLQGMLRRMAKSGIIEMKSLQGKPTIYKSLDLTKSITEYKTNDGDSRKFPRVGKQYIDISELAIQCLSGKKLDENELIKAIMEKITEIKRKE